MYTNEKTDKGYHGWIAGCFVGLIEGVGGQVYWTHVPVCTCRAFTIHSATLQSSWSSDTLVRCTSTMLFTN